MGTDAPVYLDVVLEYFSTEVQELQKIPPKGYKKWRIDQPAVRNDNDRTRFMKDTIIVISSKTLPESHESY